MRATLGLEIGAKFMQAIALDANGRLVARSHSCRTPRKDYADFLKACQAVLRGAVPSSAQACAIGVGITGCVNRTEGTVTSYYLPFLKGKPLGADLAKLVVVDRVHLENDANCMTYAEAVDGAGKGYALVQGLLTGKGIGGGLVMNGALVRGRHGQTGEIGKAAIFPFPEYAKMLSRKGGPLLNVGDVLCANGLELLHHAMTEKEAKADEIATRAEGGDQEARKVLDRYYELMVTALKGGILTHIDPDVIVIGGGAMANLPDMYENVHSLLKSCSSSIPFTTPVIPAKDMQCAVARGAALLCHKAL